MQAFPGLTPAAIWDLPWREWVMIGDHSDRWADQQRELRAQMDKARSGKG